MKFKPIKAHMHKIVQAKILVYNVVADISASHNYFNNERIDKHANIYAYNFRK